MMIHRSFWRPRELRLMLPPMLACADVRGLALGVCAYKCVCVVVVVHVVEWGVSICGHASRA